MISVFFFQYTTSTQQSSKTSPEVKKRLHDVHSHCDETDDYSDDDDSEGEEDPEDDYSDGDDYDDDFDRYLSSVEEEERELTKMLAEATAKPLNQTISAWGMEGVKVTFDTEALELIASQVGMKKIFRQKAAN